MAIFLFNGLGLFLAAKLVSINDRPSHFLILFRFFPSRGERKNMHCILHEPVGGAPRHGCRIFRSRYRRSDLPVLTLSRI